MIPATREGRLRALIDTERAARRKAERERDRLHRLIEGSTDLRPGYEGRCKFCGVRSFGFVCAAHRDLVALDNPEVSL